MNIFQYRIFLRRLIRDFFIILTSIIIMIVIVSCTMATTTSLANEVFLNELVGEYQLSSAGSEALNTPNLYFAGTPSPLFSTKTLFFADNYGSISVFSGSAVFLVRFHYALNSEDCSAVYEVIQPYPDESGTLIKTNRFLKITISNNILFFSSSYANSQKNSEKLTTDLLFAQSL